MNKEYKFTTMLISTVLFIMGIILIVSGITYHIKNKSFMSSAVPITATIEKIESHTEWDGDKDYDVYVSFSYQDKNYSNKELGYHRSSMKVGDKLDIYYNPLTNDVGSPDINNTSVRMFMIFGTTIIVLGFLMIGLFIYRNNNLKKFITNSTRIEGCVESIEHTGIVGIFNKQPYIVKCSYYNPKTNEKYCADSPGLKKNPTDLIKPGTIVDIYVDSTYTQCFVDIFSALEKAKQNPYK